MNLYFKSKDEINTFFNQKNKKSENNSAVAVPHLKKKNTNRNSSGRRKITPDGSMKIQEEIKCNRRGKYGVKSKIILNI